MEYKLPELPECAFNIIWKHGEYKVSKPNIEKECCYTSEQMRQYAEQAVAPLLAEIERLKAEIDLIANERQDL